LAPDLVIAQAHCEVCAVTPGDVERSRCDTLAGRVLALTAGSLDDIWKVSGRSRRRSSGRVKAAPSSLTSDRPRSGADQNRGRRRPSVVIVEWADPTFAMGNWGRELVEIANGDLRLGCPGQHSRAIPGELVREADPEYI
jgi:iron complex transport system substrate-binding protein